MTSSIDDLIKLSLKNPIRIKTSSNSLTIAPRLIQEFIKIKNEEDIEAILMSLIVRNFNKHVIVFFETKKQTHRFYILLNLFQLKVAELHGDMTQTHR